MPLGCQTSIAAFHSKFVHYHQHSANLLESDLPTPPSPTPKYDHLSPTHRPHLRLRLPRRRIRQTSLPRRQLPRRPGLALTRPFPEYGHPSQYPRRPLPARNRGECLRIGEGEVGRAERGNLQWSVAQQPALNSHPLTAPSAIQPTPTLPSPKTAPSKASTSRRQPSPPHKQPT